MSIPNPEPAGSHNLVERRPPGLAAAPINLSPTLAPYYPPPAYPPSLGRSAPTDGRAITSLVASILVVISAAPSL